MWKKIVPAAMVAFAAVLMSRILPIAQPFKPRLPVNDNGNCRLLDGPWGAEDMVVTKTGWIIASSVDGSRFMDRSCAGIADDGRAGGLWTFRPTDPTSQPRRLEINGMPGAVVADDDDDKKKKETCFMTLGLFLSNATDRLYVVAHHGNESSIEIFSVVEDNEQSAGDGGGRVVSPHLKWLRSVRSTLFPNLGLNDVVEGKTGGELYVTQFLPTWAGMPPRGRRHPANTWLQKLQQALLGPVFLLGLPVTKVLRCTFAVDDPAVPAVCRDAGGVASPPLRFRTANGIAVTEDRSMVFVSDVTAFSIVVLRRNERDGSLEKVSGQILNEDGTEPLPGVGLLILNQRDTTDEFGKFEVSIPMDMQRLNHSVSAQRAGYHPLSQNFTLDGGPVEFRMRKK